MKKLSSFALCAILSTSMAQAQTVKKILFEDYTGTWCGGCPAATVLLEEIMVENPAKCIPVSWHHNDPMQIPDILAMEGEMHVSFFPVGTIDRIKFPAQDHISFHYALWENAFNSHKNDSAIVSISFESPKKNGNTYTVKVNMKFSSPPLPGVPLKMNAYLTEDSIAAVGTLEQDNYTDIQNGANPLTNWYHNATMRKAIEGTWGYAAFPASPVPGAVYSRTISFTPDAGWNPQQMNLVAFVAYDGDTALNQKQVLNADQIMLKQFDPLSLGETAGKTLTTSVYPNPAGASDMVKVSFLLKKDTRIKMELLNAAGQLVSMPYESTEIAGAHTIQLPVRQNGAALVPGVYFIRLCTEDGQSATERLQVK